MKISGDITTTWQDYPDNESLSILVYFVGCDNGCLGCQNPELQDFNTTKNVFTFSLENLEKKILDRAEREMTDKVVFEGGDPLAPYQREEVIQLTRDLESKGIKVCIYTGYPVDKVKSWNPGATWYKIGLYDQHHKRSTWGKTDESFTLVSPNQNFFDKNFNQKSVNGVLTF